MPDPTELVITCGFATALGVFAICSIARMIFSKESSRLPEVAGIPATDGSPYLPPAELALPPRLPSGRVPVWFYRPTDLVGAAFVFAVFSGLVLASLRGPHRDVSQMDPVVMLINIGFQLVMAGLVTFTVAFRINVVSWLGLRWSAWPWVFLIAPCAVFFMWLVFGGLQFCGYTKWMESLGVETVQDTVKLFQKSENSLVLGLMAFAAVIVAPVCEEIVFRGYLYPVIKKFSGIWPAAICSALVFAAAHGSLAAMLPLFLFGCLLVFIYEKTGSIWSNISVHLCFNGATVLIQLAIRHFHIPLDATP